MDRMWAGWRSAYVSAHGNGELVGAGSPFRRIIDAGIPYVVAEGEGAFYAPKIDVHIRDALKRRWQMSTLQVDFQFPDRFDLEYVGADNERHVGELRRRPAEKLIEFKLPEGAGQQIVAAQHLSNAHRVIIDDDGQLIRGRAVGLGDDEVAKIGGEVAGLGAGDEVVERALTVGRPQAPNEG